MNDRLPNLISALATYNLMLRGGFVLGERAEEIKLRVKLLEIRLRLLKAEELVDLDEVGWIPRAS